MKCKFHKDGKCAEVVDCVKCGKRKCSGDCFLVQYGWLCVDCALGIDKYAD